MLIRIAKRNLVFQYLLVFAVSLLLFGKTFLTKDFLHNAIWLAWLLHTAWALSIGWVAAKHRLSRNPGLIALIFLCLNTAHTGTGYSNLLWIYPLFILSFYYGLSIYGHDKPYPAIFNSAVFWSAATVFCPELLFFGFPGFSMDILLPGILGLGCTVLSFLSMLSLRRNKQDLNMAERHRASALTALFFYFCVFTAITKIHPNSVFPLFVPSAFFCSKFLLNMKSETGKDLILLGIVALSLLACYL